MTVLRTGRLDEVVPLRLGVLGWQTGSDDRDGLRGAAHLVVERDGVVVGCCSTVPRALDGVPALHVYAAAVAAGYRGAGAGRSLYAAAVARARAEGLDLVWGRARESAVGYWVSLGMEVRGPWFYEPLNGQREQVVVAVVGSAA